MDTFCYNATRSDGSEAMQSLFTIERDAMFVTGKSESCVVVLYWKWAVIGSVDCSGCAPKISNRPILTSGLNSGARFSLQLNSGARF